MRFGPPLRIRRALVIATGAAAILGTTVVADQMVTAGPQGDGTGVTSYGWTGRQTDRPGRQDVDGELVIREVDATPPVAPWPHATTINATIARAATGLTPIATGARVRGYSVPLEVYQPP